LLTCLTSQPAYRHAFTAAFLFIIYVPTSLPACQPAFLPATSLPACLSVYLSVQ
jgi:hypothetical protein